MKNIFVQRKKVYLMSSKEKHKKRSQRSSHKDGVGMGFMMTPSNRKTDARKKINEIKRAKNG